MNLVDLLLWSRSSLNSSKIFGISDVSHAPRDCKVVSGTSRSRPTLLGVADRTNSAVGVSAEVVGAGVVAAGEMVESGRRVVGRSGCLMGEMARETEGGGGGRGGVEKMAGGPGLKRLEEKQFD